MDKCREAFEAKYRELHPNDKCTLMANGNYSGWIKQAHWWAWQSRQPEVDQLREELAKLKDRLELAHHLATQSTWSSLKQLRKVVKALRGEHEA